MTTRIRRHNDTYTPKLNKGWVRMPHPVTLRTLALRQVLKVLSTIHQPISHEKLEDLRKYISTNILTIFYEEIIHLGHKCLLKPMSMINILFAFPTAAFESNLELLGYYDGTECCKPNSSTNWIYGFIPDICVNVFGCRRLFTLLKDADLTKLKNLALWAEEHAFTGSCLPYILTKAHNLTRLVLRGDADDHILRIVGANCHQLKILDVSRSGRVSSKGLINLLLKKPIGRNRDPPTNVAQVRENGRRAIAASLNRITISSGKILLEHVNVLASLLENVYILYRLPEIEIIRPVTGTSLMRGMKWDGGWMAQHVFGTIFEEWIGNSIWQKFSEILKCSLLNGQNNIHLDTYQVEDHTENSGIHVYARRSNHSLLRGYYMISSTLGVVEMRLFWDNFQWDVEDILQLTDIATQAPNLTRLETRLSGTWEGTGPALQKLTEIRIWTLDDTTVISLLRTCPNLRYVDIKNIRSFSELPDEDIPVLTHPVLLDIIVKNPRIWTKIREFIIRPTNLTKDSVLKLIEICPELKRVGDLECWDVTEDEIQELNNKLFEANSQTVLVVLSFPPRRE